MVSCPFQTTSFLISGSNYFRWPFLVLWSSLKSQSTSSVEKNHLKYFSLKHCMCVFVGGNDSFMPGPMPSSGMQDMYPRGPQAMGMRPQYPYSQGFDRRSVIFHNKLLDSLTRLSIQLHAFCHVSSSGLTMPWAPMVEWCLLEIRTT